MIKSDWFSDGKPITIDLDLSTWSLYTLHLWKNKFFLLRSVQQCHSKFNTISPCNQFCKELLNLKSKTYLRQKKLELKLNWLKKIWTEFTGKGSLRDLTVWSIKKRLSFRLSWLLLSKYFSIQAWRLWHFWLLDLHRWNWKNFSSF